MLKLLLYIEHIGNETQKPQLASVVIDDFPVNGEKIKNHLHPVLFLLGSWEGTVVIV